MKEKQLLLSGLAVTIVCLSFLYLFGKPTATSYESEIKSNVLSPVAKWNILLDKVSMTSEIEKPIMLNDITWQNLHADSKTVSPGSKGVLKLEIDPTSTEVAIRFDIIFIDSSKDSKYILKLKNISMTDGTLIKTNDTTYTGIISLSEVEAKKKKELVLELEWENSEENNERDSLIGLGIENPEMLSLSLIASQYQGEEIKEN